ncbi:MAG: SIMPL domain-containing protein [Bacteroidia bacterium]
MMTADILDNPTRDWNTKSKSNVESNSFVPYKRLVSISDSTFLITGRILMNLEADAYKITFSLSQQAESILKSNELINNRINSFTNDIKRLGINDGDIYIDVVAQYPIYGYDLEKISNPAKEGYEINKNVIVRFDSLALVEQLISLAAQNDIHDAVKLDYILYDIEGVYEGCFLKPLPLLRKRRSYTCLLPT